MLWRLGVTSLTSGAAYALLGLCLVVLYRLTGTLNFAQAAIGALATFTAIEATGPGASRWWFVTVGLLVGSAIGAITGAGYARWYRDKGVVIRSTVSIPLLVAYSAIAFRAFGDRPRTFAPLVPGRAFALGGAAVMYATLLALLLVGVVAIGLRTLIAHTRVGIRLRAMAEAPVTAELLGVRVGRLTAAVWAVAGAVATLAVMFVAPVRGGTFSPLAVLILPALAAALIGGFERGGVTILAGFGIALIEALGSNWPSIGVYRTSLPFFIIVVALLWQQRAEVWDEAR